jgi:hypothetical protein
MSGHPPVSAPGVAENHRRLRAVALVAVIIGVLALAAAAFLLSYSGIHAIALTAGVTPSLARLYPLILDAMLVIACAAVLSLRGAGLLARCYAWLSMLVLLAAVAGADALHATGTKLPHRPAAAAVAIIPWALVLVGFGLLLSMLRHARQRLNAAQQVPAPAPPASQDQPRLGIDDLLTPKAPEQLVAVRPVPRPAELAAPAAMAGAATVADTTTVTDTTAVAGPATVADTTPVAPADETGPAQVASPAQATSPADEAVAADTAEATGVADHGADLAIDTEPGQDDPTSDEAHLASQPVMAWVPPARAELSPEDEVTYSGGYPATGLSPAPTIDYVVGAEANRGDVADHDAAVTQPGQQAYDTAAEPDQQAYDTASAHLAQPDDQAAQQEPADEVTLTQPEPAALPQFLRKWSSPTPPEG